MIHTRPVVFVMVGAYDSKGGMASLNRNLIVNLEQLARKHRRPFYVLSFLEDATARPPTLAPNVPFEPFHHSKRPLFKRMLALAWQRPTYVIDHVTLALPLIPLAATRWVRTVILAHDAEASNHVLPLSRWSFRFASLVLADSHNTLKRMQAHRVKSNAIVSPLGLSIEFPLNATLPPPSLEPIELTDAEGNPQQLGARVLLLVARINTGERGKGHTELMQVLPALAAKFPDVQLVMPGPGDDSDHLAELARTNRVGSRVFLPGYISTELLLRLYHHCYAFVMPNPQEGFGMVYLEAMNFAKPCVGCLGSGATEVIVPDKTGYLVRSPVERAELECVLSELLSNPERAAELGRAGFERLHQNFTPAIYQARFNRNVERVLA